MHVGRTVFSQLMDFLPMHQFRLFPILRHKIPHGACERAIDVYRQLK